MQGKKVQYTGVGVCVAVGVAVMVGVAVGVPLGVAVGVFVGVEVTVPVGVGVPVCVGVGVGGGVPVAQILSTSMKPSPTTSMQRVWVPQGMLYSLTTCQCRVGE